uniref:Uncharacterized protein n=1 Tax=Parascaris equorum TaxID=6256 RepID=A0A914RZG7_PAREQ
SLAAWSREKSPRTIRAAVASSAPLLAKVDFSEFGKQVEAIITRADSKCASDIRSLFRSIKEKMRSVEGRQEIVRIFRLDDSLSREKVSEKDVQNFFFVVRNYISYIVMHSSINAVSHLRLPSKFPTQYLVFFGRVLLFHISIEVCRRSGTAWTQQRDNLWAPCNGFEHP